MKIKVVSDLHLEFGDINIVNNGVDVLILGGDIMIAQDLHDHPETDYSQLPNIGKKKAIVSLFRNFLNRVSNDFKHVIYIAGNHEFYHGKWFAALDYLRDECAKYPNIYFLENDTKVIDDVAFIGATLWTDMNGRDPYTMYTISNQMNDFKIIRHDKEKYRRVTPNDTVARHSNSLKYFKESIDKHSDKRCVIVSHMAPTFASVHPKYTKDKAMNGGYASKLDDFILDHSQIKLWTHGHMHDPFDYMVGTTRVVCNPRGYNGYESTNWDPTIIVEI